MKMVLYDVLTSPGGVLFIIVFYYLGLVLFLKLFGFNLNKAMGRWIPALWNYIFKPHNYKSKDYRRKK